MQTLSFFRTKKAALAVVGSLSDTSKMPGTSWGINADRCQTGAKLAQVPGSICSTCYAQKGFYAVFPAVKRAQDFRLELFTENLPAWTAGMVKLLEKESFFRWFDSGDLQSLDMLRAIVEIARATPHVRHWLATRERAVVKAWIAEDGNWPANLVCRISATFFDEVPANKLTPWSSMAHRDEPRADVYACPAPSQGGNCGDCRACWSQSVPLVSYHAH